MQHQLGLSIKHARFSHGVRGPRAISHVLTVEKRSSSGSMNTWSPTMYVGFIWQVSMFEQEIDCFLFWSGVHFIRGNQSGCAVMRKRDCSLKLGLKLFFHDRWMSSPQTADSWNLSSTWCKLTLLTSFALFSCRCMLVTDFLSWLQCWMRVYGTARVLYGNVLSVASTVLSESSTWHESFVVLMVSSYWDLVPSLLQPWVNLPSFQF